MYSYIRMRLQVLKNEDGASAVEYGLLVALIAIIIIAGVTILGTNLRELFFETSSALS